MKLEDFLKKNFPDTCSPFEGTSIKKVHIENPMGFTYRNLEIMKRSQNNENFQTEKAIEIDAKETLILLI